MYYDPKESGLRIQNLRKKKGITQEQMAESLNLAVSSVGNIERGLRGVSIDLVVELAFFFDVSIDYIVLGRDMQEVVQKNNDIHKKQLAEAIKMLMQVEKEL